VTGITAAVAAIPPRVYSQSQQQQQQQQQQQLAAQAHEQLDAISDRGSDGSFSMAASSSPIYPPVSALHSRQSMLSSSSASEQRNVDEPEGPGDADADVDPESQIQLAHSYGSDGAMENAIFGMDPVGNDEFRDARGPMATTPTSSTIGRRPPIAPVEPVPVEVSGTGATSLSLSNRSVQSNNGK
jgi:type II secretory pathway pseudopilin PulG